MADIRVIFFDVGGVLLTNAWDRVARQEAIQEFALDDIEFADRHEQVIAAFETGHLTESRYLERTVFHRDRSFTPEDFRSFMYGRTRMLDDNAFDIVDALNGRDNVLLATLNNESRELNDWRIRHYGLIASTSLSAPATWAFASPTPPSTGWPSISRNVRPKRARSSTTDRSIRNAPESSASTRSTTVEAMTFASN